MKDTSNYRTKTNFIKRNNKTIPGHWIVAIDVGYSAVKLFSPNTVARFPSYAKKVKSNFSFIGEATESSILYKDFEKNELWVVGKVAQDLMLTQKDTADSEKRLYGRNRYNSDIFKIITRVGLAVGMLPNEYGCMKEEEKLIVQTGLPEQYMDDEDELKDAMSGYHHFAIKIGTGEWKEFNFSLDFDNIYIMSQPEGTLFSVCIDKSGQFHPNTSSYLKSSTLVFDPGFGTLDIFPIEAGSVGDGETHSDLGMKRILHETAKLIKEKYNINISVPAMQNNLEKGTVRYFDKKNLITKDYEFGDLLKTATERVCEEALMRMLESIELQEYKYLIVTGGTGAAWFNQIKNKFKNITTLEVLQGN